MFTVLLVLQVVMGLAIIGLVLLQQGKGADMGAAFGAGASGTVFGARGGGSFFTRATAVIATLFFINSIVLSSPLVLEQQDPAASVTTGVPAAPIDEVPADEVAPDETVVDEAQDTDLPPADMPDIPADLPPAESDLPE